MTIGQKIKRARQEAGFRNAEQFAVALDVSFSTVGRWEQGKTTPTVARLVQIGRMTDKTLSYFLDEVEAVA
jgi:transcriptional regulator with XRE-family HTH domain